MGKDRVGWMYLDLACRAAEEYATARSSQATEEERRIEETVVNWTLWGNFSMAAYVRCNPCSDIFFPLTCLVPPRRRS